MSLLRIQKYLTPNVIDYCSPLADLSQVLAQLQSQPPKPVPRPGLIIEGIRVKNFELVEIYLKIKCNPFNSRGGGESTTGINLSIHVSPTSKGSNENMVRSI